MKIQVKVKLNSKQQKIEELSDESFIVHFKSLAIKEIDQELIKLLVERYKVTQSQITIKHGLSKQKLVVIG